MLQLGPEKGRATMPEKGHFKPPSHKLGNVVGDSPSLWAVSRGRRGVDLKQSLWCISEWKYCVSRCKWKYCVFLCK